MTFRRPSDQPPSLRFVAFARYGCHFGEKGLCDTSIGSADNLQEALAAIGPYSQPASKVIDLHTGETVTPRVRYCGKSSPTA